MAFEKINALEAAKIKGVRYTTFHNLLQRGEGPPAHVAGKVRYFLRHEVEAWKVPEYGKRGPVNRPQSSWKPHYDAIYIGHHARGMSDVMITSFMKDDGLGVSSTDVAAARRRLGLAANKNLAPQVFEASRPLPEKRPDPLEAAVKHLPGFCRVTMTVPQDGRRYPIRLQLAIQRTNAILKAKKLPQVGPRELWV